MTLRDLLRVFDDLQRVRVVRDEESVTGEVCAIQKLFNEETLSLEVTCAAASDSILKVWVGDDN